MAQLHSSGPYIWVTWAAKLLTGENSCEWAAWFKAHHESWSWEKVSSGFDQAGWMIKHTALVNQLRAEWEDKGYTLTAEGQNSFVLRGSAATLAGKPDLIAVRDKEAVIIDAKTGKPQPPHSAQVMIYQYAVPKGVERHRGLEFRAGGVYGTRGRNTPGVRGPSVREEPECPGAASGKGRPGPAGAVRRRVPVLRHHEG